MSEPLITTVIPTYNRPNIVVNAVESAIAQTYPTDLHEIIVVDDGSDDPQETAAALRHFGDRVRLLRKRNGGVSSARNLGIAHARGKLIAFLDSDDVWLPEKLELQASTFHTKPDIGIVLTSFIGINAKQQTVILPQRRVHFPRDGRILNDVLLNPLMAPSTAMVRRSVFEDVGGFDESLRTAEDIDFFLRAARRTGIALVDKALVRYRVSIDSAKSLSNQPGSYDDYMTVMSRGRDPSRAAG
jgi:glycosyltransferase involved in cell wall biosynthesis